MSKKYIPIILGTGREGRQSEAVAKYVYETVKKLDMVETELIDVRDYSRLYTVPAWLEDNPETEPWKEIVRKADGFILVIPEYNHGYPGEFKIMWDGAYKEYFGKRIGVVTVSNGGFGGVRALEHLLPIFQTCQLCLVPNPIHVSNVPDEFKKSKEDLDGAHKEKVDSMVKELAK